MGLRTDSNKQIVQLKKPEKLKIRQYTFAWLIDALLMSYAGLVTYKIIWQKWILNARHADFVWSEAGLALGFGALIATVLMFTSVSVGKWTQRLISLNENTSWVKQPLGISTLIYIALTFLAGISVTQMSLRELFSESGVTGASRIFTAILNPNWQIFDQALFAAIETIYMAFIATTMALPMAFLLGFFAARNLMSSSPTMLFIYSCVRFFLNVTRSIEPLVWAIIFSVWVGIGPFAGMLALCLHSISSLTKLYSEQIENINDGPLEAMRATGAHPIQVVWFGVVPQIVLPYLSYTIYRWDINVRMATVIGLVGGGGIGTLLMQYQGLAKWNEVGLLVIVIAAIVWIMDYASSKIREALK